MVGVGDEHRVEPLERARAPAPRHDAPDVHQAVASIGSVRNRRSRDLEQRGRMAYVGDDVAHRAELPRSLASTTCLAIETRALERTFSGDIKAVQGVDLEVAEGEIYAFLGPNGAGKTTTVRMLTTLLRPTGGGATVAGFDVVKEAAKVRRAIGVALQEAALDPLMTGRELMQLQATLHGIPKAEAKQRGDALIARVGLSNAADRRVGTYSGGMRRRLDLGTALVHEPSVLFLDEPTTGLDPASRAAIWEEVRKLNDEGTTVFLTTQYLEEADQLADRVGIIDDGLMAAEGTPRAAEGAGRQAAARAEPRRGQPRGLRVRARPVRRAAARRRTGWSSSRSRRAPPGSPRSSARSTRRASPCRTCISPSPRSTTSSSRRRAAISRAPRRGGAGARAGAGLTHNARDRRRALDALAEAGVPPASVPHADHHLPDAVPRR